MKLVFILSLPRSGSTLIQRVIASHPKVSTISEPWIQLPLSSIIRDEHIYTDYSHLLARRAISDMVKKLPHGEEDIYEAIRNFSYDLYSKISDEEAFYFIDKTPRYHIIAPLLKQIYPDAKFIILWRNPLAIVSSMIETWGKGKWILHRYKVDIYEGINNLAKFEQLSTNVISTNFELLTGENANLHWEKLFHFLDLDFNPEYITNYQNLKLVGSMGDPKRNNYNKIIDKSSEWRNSFDNIIRIKWAKYYLKWIGESRLLQMGYNYDEIKNLLPKSLFSRNFLSDFKAFGISILKPWIEPYILKNKLKEIGRKVLLNHK